MCARLSFKICSLFRWASGPVPSEGDRRGQRGSVGTDGKEIQCLLGLVLFYGWGNGSHIGFLDGMRRVTLVATRSPTKAGK